MKFRLPKDVAKKSIAYILSVVNESTVLVSSNKEHQKVAFESASQGVYVRVNVPAVVESDGVVAIDGSQLSGIKFPVDVDIAATDGLLSFASGTLRGSIHVVPVGGQIKAQRPQGTPNSWVKIPKDQFLAAVNATVFSACMKGSIDGVTLRVENSTLIMHAFDAVRASLYSHPLDQAGEHRAVLATNFFSAMKKIPGDDIELAFDPGSIRVRTPSAVMSYPTLQVETQDVYADTMELLQTPCSGEFTVSAKRFGDAVSTVASVLRGSMDFDTRIDFKVTDTSMDIALSSEHGQMRDSVALEGPVKACAFTLSGKHIADMLALLNGDIRVRYYGSTVLFVSNDGHATVVLATLA